MMHGLKTTQHQGAIEAARKGAAAPWPGCAFGQGGMSCVSLRVDGVVLAPAQEPGFARVSSGGAAYVFDAAEIVATVVAFALPVVSTTGAQTVSAGTAGKAGKIAAALADSQATSTVAAMATSAPTTEPFLDAANYKLHVQLRRNGASLESGKSRSGLASCDEAALTGHTGEAGQDGGAWHGRTAATGTETGKDGRRPKQPDAAPATGPTAQPKGAP